METNTGDNTEPNYATTQPSTFSQETLDRLVREAHERERNRRDEELLVRFACAALTHTASRVEFGNYFTYDAARDALDVAEAMLSEFKRRTTKGAK